MEPDDTTSSARRHRRSNRHISVHTIPKSRTQFNHNAQLAQCGSVEFAAERNLMTRHLPPGTIGTLRGIMETHRLHDDGIPTTI